MLTTISFILVFSMLVFFHELGHFSVAKWSGILVHEFSIGMGPKIISKTKGETTYSLRALPIGGYVKMEGENEESDNPRAFSQKSALTRFAVVIAGPLMNFILAIVLFLIIFTTLGIPTTTIDKVRENSPAMEVGILSGDKIVEVDGQGVKSWDKLVQKINESSDSVEILVKRDGEVKEFSIHTEKDEQSGRNVIGITPTFSKNPVMTLPKSVYQVYFLTKSIFDFLGDKIMGTGEAEGEIVGPIGMVNIVGQAAKMGIFNLIMLAAYFSINLGIINLLPIPALDGGRLIFIIFEIIRGKAINQEKEAIAHTMGFVVLMLFMLFIFMKELTPILQGYLVK